MFPPFSTIATDDPASTSFSAVRSATAPATPAMGPTPASSDALHILCIRGSSLSEVGYGSYVIPKKGSSAIFLSTIDRASKTPSGMWDSIPSSHTTVRMVSMYWKRVLIARVVWL